MSRPRLLDLFCGAGGCSVGYHRAGFEVVGVDVKYQPNYPYEFHQGDALEYLREHGHEFDAIHASPPCQAYSVTNSLHGNEHPQLLEPVRELLIATGKPYVIENVVGAPMDPFITLCGSSFGLNVRRHRRFESSHVLFAPECRHDLYPEPIEVVGMGGPSPRHRKPRGLSEARAVMGIDWMNRYELTQAIPPAYTEFIGTQLLRSMEYSR